MKDVQCYELFGGIAHKNNAFSFFFIYETDIQARRPICTITHDVL